MTNDSGKKSADLQSSHLSDEQLKDVSGGTDSGTGAWYARCGRGGCTWVSEPCESDLIALYKYNEIHDSMTGHMSAVVYYE